VWERLSNAAGPTNYAAICLKPNSMGRLYDGRFAFKFNLERTLWPPIRPRALLVLEDDDELWTAVTDQLVR